jgi:putative pyruvate formate lyase activating enzyme
MNTFQASYLKLLESGELKTRVASGYEHLSSCNICAHHCEVNRREEEFGICKTGLRAKISSYGPHMGEEDPLRGTQGSGTIFFTRCNLRCQYCQNHDISQTDSGYEVEPEELAEIMLELQDAGCHNINFVSPSHVVPQILAGVLIAAYAGLNIPLVYNTGGYDSLSTLSLLLDVIDIYMPDMKYADADIARRFSKIPDYPQINQTAVKEMHSQVGDLVINDRGLALRGLLVRHLILPNNLAGTEKILEFLANRISKNTYLNLMDQYRPAFKAHHYPEINRRITKEEYQQAVDSAIRLGLTRLDKRHSPLFWL